MSEEEKKEMEEKTPQHIHDEALSDETNERVTTN
jgi:hypothetical protein